MSSVFAHPETRLQAEFQALSRLAKTLVLPLELEPLLQAALEVLVESLEPAQSGMVLLEDHSTGALQPLTRCEYAGAEILPPDGSPGSLCALSLAESQALLSFSANDMENETPVCTLAAPLRTERCSYGVLMLESRDGGAIFSPADLPFLQSLADLIALTIEREYATEQAAVTQEKRLAERLHSELIAAISHELRLPLTAIMGYASALLLDEIEWSLEKQLEFINLIVEESESMQVMLTALLDSAILDGDQFFLQPQQLYMGQLTREVAAEFQLRTAKHRLIAELPADFPPISADHHWIKQVLRNILDNAVKYSPEGGLIVMRGEVRQKDVIISIADQGIGIAPEDIPLLFEKYYRVKSPKNVQIPGTGLGLPIARKIVESHDGRIWVESVVGQGTTVSFSLPYSRDIN